MQDDDRRTEPRVLQPNRAAAPVDRVRLNLRCMKIDRDRNKDVVRSTPRAAMLTKWDIEVELRQIVHERRNRSCVAPSGHRQLAEQLEAVRRMQVPANGQLVVAALTRTTPTCEKSMPRRLGLKTESDRLRELIEVSRTVDHLARRSRG